MFPKVQRIIPTFSTLLDWKSQMARPRHDFCLHLEQLSHLLAYRLLNRPANFWNIRPLLPFPPLKKNIPQETAVGSVVTLFEQRNQAAGSLQDWSRWGLSFQRVKPEPSWQHTEVKTEAQGSALLVLPCIARSRCEMTDRTTM